MKKNRHSIPIAEYLVNLQPPAVLVRLQEGDTLEGLDLKTHEGFKIDEAHVLMPSLLAAVRKLNSGNPEERLGFIGEGEATLRRDEGTFIVSVRQDARVLNARLSFLGLASEDRADRTGAFEQAVEQLGPTADISRFRDIMDERPLADEEIDVIAHEIFGGIENIQSQFRERLADGEATLEDLIPESFEYYEKFCGPNPGDLNPGVYLGSVLPDYRRELLHRDLLRGLEICLLGALRDDLCPGQWLAAVDSDLLWNSLTTSQPELDPISLFAALDLALYRTKIKSFRTFAGDAARLLRKEQFLITDGIDGYKLLPLLARFVLNRLNVMDDGALRPPYWKQMCAWMQAAFISRLMIDSAIDFDKFAEATNSSLKVAGEHANVVDLRKHR
jgi:hypothetical protein